MMKVPLLDLVAQYQALQPEIEAAVLRVFASQQFVLGPDVTDCEAALAAYCQCPHGCGVSSGTDALLMALMNEGIGPGDEVITTPYTFFATAGSIARTGATPVFVDIDPESYNLRPELLAAAVTDRTRAIIPVHLYGQMADMDPIMELARARDLVVIEDAAQAVGAEYKGRRAGSIGDYGCFSFFPSKNLGGAGDGGMVTTTDPDRAGRLKILRNHGMQPKYRHGVIGGNFRLDSLQAAVINVKLRYLDQWTQGRQQNALRYERMLEAAGIPADQIRRPWFPPSTRDAGSGDCTCRHVFNQYIIRSPQRDELRARLTEQGIGTEIYYPIPLHLQPCFEYLGHQAGQFPESERAARETLALPIYPELSDPQAQAVVDALAGAQSAHT